MTPLAQLADALGLGMATGALSCSISARRCSTPRRSRLRRSISMSMPLMRLEISSSAVLVSSRPAIASVSRCLASASAASASGVFGGLGGQQLARLQAHEPLAQRVSRALAVSSCGFRRLRSASRRAMSVSSASMRAWRASSSK